MAIHPLTSQLRTFTGVTSVDLLFYHTYYKQLGAVIQTEVLYIVKLLRNMVE